MTDKQKTAAAAPPAGSDPYDVVPYESHAYDFTEPQRLHAIGRLFGLTPPDFRTARVLELGCSGGGNIVPMAVRYPQATFVGVDLSAVEIREAQALVDELRLTNMTFHEMSIADIAPDFGTFDYIIAHGVFSWVPAPVREAIIRICKENLAPHGLALISYNTLPGWNHARAVRDMMLYHCSRFATLREKIEQGIALLRFVLETTHPGLTAYRESVESELKFLTSRRASHIFHDHLSRENYALHLHEMDAMARAQGLEYVGDANLETMYLQNFPAKVAEALAAAGDAVRIEQYLDFITNRRFRISLFCHASNTPRRQLEMAQILDFHIGSRLVPPPSPPDLARDTNTAFKTRSGLEITAGNRYANAVLGVLSGLGHDILPANEIIAAAARALAPSLSGPGPENEERVRSAFVEIGLQLIFRGALVLHSAAPGHMREISTRPMVFAAARAISRRNDVVPTVLHQNLSFDPGSRALMQLCDGTRDRAALTEEITTRLARGELSMARGGEPVTDPSSARSDVVAWIEATLRQFADLGLLVG